MNVLPLPNFFNRAISGGNYNYQIQEVQKDPKRSQLFKIDYVPTEKDRFFVRGKTWNAQQEGYAVAGGATPVGFFGQCYCFTESGLAVGETHIFSPNVVMEISTGVRHNHESWMPYGSPNEINKVLRSKHRLQPGPVVSIGERERLHSALLVRRRAQRAERQLRQPAADRRHRFHVQFQRQRHDQQAARTASSWDSTSTASASTKASRAFSAGPSISARTR